VSEGSSVRPRLVISNWVISERAGTVRSERAKVGLTVRVESAATVQNGSVGGRFDTDRNSVTRLREPDGIIRLCWPAVRSDVLDPRIG
jgi:hypothetical protein